MAFSETTIRACRFVASLVGLCIVLWFLYDYPDITQELLLALFTAASFWLLDCILHHGLTMNPFLVMGAGIASCVLAGVYMSNGGDDRSLYIGFLAAIALNTAISAASLLHHLVRLLRNRR